MNIQPRDVAVNHVRVSQTLIEDAELAYNNLSNQEVQLIRETEDLFKQQSRFIQLIDELKQHLPDMTMIRKESWQLANLVESSLKLVGEVSVSFKRMDLAKSRVTDSIDKICDILDLKTCRDELMLAMQTNDYEQAAMQVKRFLSINQDELFKTAEIVSTDHKSVDLTVRELDEARCRLIKICQDQMNRAITEDDTKTIERVFKLFPLLDQHNDGLLRYSDYIKSKIMNSQLDLTLHSKDTNQADKLAALFERVAKLVDSHQPTIDTYYGPGYLIVVARVLQRECDSLSRKILEEFRNETNLQHVAKVVRGASHFPIVSDTSQDTNNLNLTLNTKLDPRNLDAILNEIATILSRSEVYLNFIVAKIQEDIDSKSENELRKKSDRIELYNMINLECELNHLIQEVGGIYVMLEQFYLNECSKKAIIMDQIDMDTSYTSCIISSMLDDIFFIIKKCTKRAISTKSNEVFCAVINHCVTLLESTFCKLLEGRLKSLQYIGDFSATSMDFSQAYNVKFSRYLQSKDDHKKSNAHYFSALNNLDKASDYIETLKGLLVADVKKLRPSRLLGVNQAEKSLACLNEFSRLSVKFNSIINSTLYQLFNTSLRAKIKSDLKNIATENQELISIVAVSNPVELTDLANKLLRMSDPSIEESLLPQNYARLCSITKDFISSTLRAMQH